MCVVVYYYSDIKICGEGGGAGGRAADQRGAGAAAAARHLGLQRADSKICSTDWNRLRVCRSALFAALKIGHKFVGYKEEKCNTEAKIKLMHCKALENFQWVV